MPCINEGRHHLFKTAGLPGLYSAFIIGMTIGILNRKFFGKIFFDLSIRKLQGFFGLNNHRNFGRIIFRIF